MTRQDLVIGSVIALMVTVVAMMSASVPPLTDQSAAPQPDYLRAIFHPLHFRPAIEKTSDEQCLACHKEVLEDRVRETSPAGVKAIETRAWYQQLNTYAGEQDTFHRRHLLAPLAQQLMALRCNTCHEGHDPREEAPGSSATSASQGETGFTLRKQVNPETTCLKCHGQMDWQLMGLPGAWPGIREQMGNSCMTCHAVIRTNRHNVNYLNARAIEAAGQNSADVCYGCHGGRAWYRIAYPYPRHPWPDMPPAPEALKNRPTRSETRFEKPGPPNPSHAPVQ